MKNVVLFIALFLFGISVSATNPKESRTRYYRHEVNVSIAGMNHSNSGSDAFENKLMDRFGLLSLNEGDGRLVHFGHDGPDLAQDGSSVILGYYYHINQRIAVGGFFNYTKVSDTLGWEVPYELDGKYLEGYSYVKGRSFFLMPSIKYSWLNNRWCSLYSKASCGVNYQSLEFESEVLPQRLYEDCDKKNNVQFAYVFTPVGWEIGKQKVRWFIEWGIGSNSIFQMGLTYRFKRF